MCIDFRKLNAITKVDAEPIPRIDTLLDQVGKATIFSSLDILSAYYHIPIRPEDSEKLAFTSNSGLYQFNRLCFGLKNAPSIFQRALRQVLQKYNLPFLVNYFDDLLIFSNSYEEHADHLRQILEICITENLKLKLSKCQIAREEINFLGYTLTKGTYSPTNINIDVINRILPPNDVKGLQRFLGSINVYRKFIKDYAEIRTPLNRLLRKDEPWNWSSECQEAYTQLKEALTKKPILRLYNPDLPFHLFVDASTNAIGAVLKQEHPEGLLPICFHSRQLRKYERNYSVSELECLAIIDSLDTFQVYLHGAFVTIHTDHKALIWLSRIKNPAGRLFRWSLKLSQFDFLIKHLPGRLQFESDWLTRSNLSPPSQSSLHAIIFKAPRETNNQEVKPAEKKHEPVPAPHRERKQNPMFGQKTKSFFFHGKRPKQSSLIKASAKAKPRLKSKK